MVDNRLPAPSPNDLRNYNPLPTVGGARPVAGATPLTLPKKFMHSNQLIKAVFREKKIQYYSELAGLSELDLPFTNKDKSAIEWNLMFVAIACSFHNRTDYKAEIEKRLMETLWNPNFQSPMRIGDYVNSKVEIDAIKPYLVFGGIFGTTNDKKTSLRLISARTANIKLKILVGYLEGKGREYNAEILPDSLTLPPLIASLILRSYMGVDLDYDFDDDYFDALSTIAKKLVEDIEVACA